MSSPRKIEWSKTDTIAVWKGLKPAEQKLYIADIRARLKKPPTQEVTNWLKKPEHRDVKTAVMKGSIPSSGSPRAVSGEASAVLAFQLAKKGFLKPGEDPDSVTDGDWKKDWKNLPVLHKAIRKLTVDPKHAAYVKQWLKDDSRKDLRLLVNNCKPIDYATLKGIVEADDPEKVANYNNMNRDDQAWVEGLRHIFKVDHLGQMGGPGGKRSKVEDA